MNISVSDGIIIAVIVEDFDVVATRLPTVKQLGSHIYQLVFCFHSFVKRFLLALLNTFIIKSSVIVHMSFSRISSLILSGDIKLIKVCFHVKESVRGMKLIVKEFLWIRSRCVNCVIRSGEEVTRLLDTLYGPGLGTVLMICLVFLLALLAKCKGIVIALVMRPVLTSMI